MSKVKITGNTSGTGVFTIEAPGTNNPRTITLPDSTGTILDENSSLPAANLTGTVPSAALGNVDLTAVNQSIATLGLHIGVSANAVAFNLPNAFIDAFEDDSGLTTQTDVDRDVTGEYVSSISAGVGKTATLNANGGTAPVRSSTQAKFGTYSAYFAGNGGTLNFADHNDFDFGSGDFTIEYWLYPTTAGRHKLRRGSTDYTAYFLGENGNAAYISSNGSQWNILSNQSMGTETTGVWQHYALVRNGNVFTTYRNGVVVDANTSSATINDRASEIFSIGGHTGQASWTYHGYMDEVRISDSARYTGDFSGSVPSAAFTADANTKLLLHMDDVGLTDSPPGTVSATGTLISDTQTAPAATTEVSGVILYKDNGSGTTTLGTDLKIYMTANLQGSTPNWTGTNWTDVGDTGGDGGGYGTAQTFSGTTKQVKLGKTTVTSGTQVAMKAVWANQAEPGATQVAQNTGTAIGDMTIQGGLAGAFDGVYPGGYTQAAGINADVGHIGKDWGSGNTKTITGIKYWVPTGTNGTFIAGGGTVSVRLEGSSDNSTWVNLGQEIISNIPSTQYSRMSGFTQTAYRYHRLRVEYVGGGGSRADIAELQFFVSDGSGKQTQLHGWAVNY